MNHDDGFGGPRPGEGRFEGPRPGGGGGNNGSVWDNYDTGNNTPTASPSAEISATDMRLRKLSTPKGDA